MRATNTSHFLLFFDLGYAVFVSIHLLAMGNTVVAIEKRELRYAVPIKVVFRRLDHTNM